MGGIIPDPQASNPACFEHSRGSAHRTGEIEMAAGVLGVGIGITKSVSAAFPMARTAALCFGMLGLAFVAIGLGRRVMARAAASAAGAIGLVILYRNMTGGQAGVEKLMFRIPWPATLEFYGMNPNTALGLVAIALAALLLSARRRVRWQLTGAAVCGSAGFAIGLNGIAGSLTGLLTTYGWSNFGGMGLASSIGLVLLGVSVLAVSWREGRDLPADHSAWALIVVSMTGAITSLSLWQALLLAGRLHLDSAARLRSDLAGAVLIFGLLATALLAAALYMTQTASRRQAIAEGLRHRAETELAERNRAEAEIRRLNSKLEERVRQRTAELEAANRELESFSFTVSHDLRAPLRAISGLSEILLDDYGHQLPPDAQRLIGSVRRNVERMGQLITDLLAFSRIGRLPLRTQAIDPAALVREALLLLAPDQEGRSVEITIGDLPVCQGDPVLLSQVFVNLLSNGLKFTRVRPVARIRVGACRGAELPQDAANPGVAPHAIAYFVADNGVGFDPCYAGNLFGAFQRLHPAADYEGNGIGLATVQRIVHRHGGLVWATSMPDRGATFYFSLGTVSAAQ